jgi:predicted RNA binding protein YcfA (HicA-like mRNA interferase family)
MKVRAVIKLIEADGWRFVRQAGSHRQFRHPSKPGTVTVAGKLSAELRPGTVANIFWQAGLRRPRT